MRIASLLCLLFTLSRGSSGERSATSLDEVPQSELFAALIARSFPLAEDAVSWETIPWSSYSKIIVSGPQRSGTTFFAWSLAQHLGYTHLDENNHVEIAVERDGKRSMLKINGTIEQMPQIMHSSQRLVMQRPRWSSQLHKLNKSEDVFVAFLARNCLDVYRSQNRIFSNERDDLGWTCKFGRTAEWRPYHEDLELNAAIDSEHDMICVIKQQAYKNLQRAELQRRSIATAALSYASFHSLGAFHNASEREGLGPKTVLTAGGSLDFKPPPAPKQARPKKHVYAS